MRYGAQQIGSHFFFFVFYPKLLLLLSLGGEGAGDDGDHEKGQKGQRVSGDLEVECPVRVSKNKVDANHSQHRSNQTEEIPIGKTGNQKNRQNKDGGCKAVGAVRHAQKHAQNPVAIQKFCQEKQNRREGRLGEDDKEKPPLNHSENLRIDTYLVYQIMHKNSVKSYEKNLGAFISF